MQMKSLKNLNSAVDKHNAVTKMYVDEKIEKKLMQSKEAEKSQFLKRKLDVDENLNKISKELSSQKTKIFREISSQK